MYLFTHLPRQCFLFISIQYLGIFFFYLKEKIPVLDILYGYILQNLNILVSGFTGGLFEIVYSTY